MTKFDAISDAVVLGVDARDREGVVGDVGRDHANRVLVNGERDRDRARSRADIGDRQRSSANEVAGGVDERLGLWPRDEDAGIDREAETVELLEAA